MKVFRFFNDLYDRLFDLKESDWLRTKAATTPFMVVFTLVLIVMFFAIIALIKMFWKP